MTLLTSTIAAAIPYVYTSGLGRSDFAEHPERYCMSYGDDPDQDLCEDVDICDEEGEITPDNDFCTGKAVRNLLYSPGGCPEGFHSTEDDESGLCYPDTEPCYPGHLSSPDTKTLP